MRRRSSSPFHDHDAHVLCGSVSTVDDDISIFTSSPKVEEKRQSIVAALAGSGTRGGSVSVSAGTRPGTGTSTNSSAGGNARNTAVAGGGVNSNGNGGGGGGGGGGAGSLASPISGGGSASAGFATVGGSAAAATAGGGPGRKRNLSIAGFDSSPGSTDDIDEAEAQEERRRTPVKRACNECRQQKLRCDVVQKPFTTCSRCHRLKLECKIESNFKRIGKRSRNAEMEREIIELRRQIASVNAGANAGQTSQQHQQQQQPQISQPQAESPSIPTSLGNNQTNMYRPQAGRVDQFMGSHEAVASLLDLRSGFDNSSYMRSPDGQIVIPKRIEDVSVAPDRVADIFNQFFTFYHPFLPFLDEEKAPNDYYSTSPLLFWTIMSVGSRRYKADTGLLNSLAGPVSRLVWSTLADVPQSYHVVKALCLLCTWPFPTSSTSTDPTFMLCGMMMQVAMQIGLHRPSHAQDFSKFRVELREEELKDRVRTWAVCNNVAQRVATGYGQPPSTLFDQTLSPNTLMDPSFKLPREIGSRLEIEKFCDKVTKTLYSNRRDPVGLSGDDERSTMRSFLSKDFDDLEDQLRSDNDPITNLYLRAANLHLRLSAFFDNPTAKDYREGLLALYIATTAFLEVALNFKTNVGPALTYTPYYIYQMTLAAGFTLLKLSKGFFATFIDMEYTKSLFNKTIWAIRSISVASNDLPERLAEVLAQMWRMGSAPNQRSTVTTDPSSTNLDSDHSLQLKVRCRMSMSLVFDSVWRWREDFQTKGRNFESYLKNPTNPDSDNSAASSVAPPRTSTSTPTLPATAGISDPSLAPAPPPPPTGIGNIPSSSAGDLTDGLPSVGIMDPTYEVFDPLNWMLDGLVDFPYSYSAMQGLEAQGIA